MAIHLVMRFDRSTPRKFRFHCDDESAPLTDIYIRKDAYARPPRSIAVTINGLEA